MDDEGDELFDWIVTGDETWVHIRTPETKMKSMVWKGKKEAALKKGKVVEFAGMVMETGIAKVRFWLTTYPVGPQSRLKC